MTDLEKLEYIHSTLQDMEHIFGIEDDMLTRSIKHVEELIEDDMVSESIAFVDELREPLLQEQSND
mgnify:CR=1 FL=1